MAYSQVKFGALKTELAQRLNDSGKVFWADAELGLDIQDALRFWNCTTGDNRKNYPLNVSPSSSQAPWYDLQTLSGSPRESTLTDRDVYTRLCYSLLEPPSSIAAVTTGQFLQDDLVQAVQRKRDEFLFRTACTSSVESLGVTPNSPTVSLPQTVIQTLRGYWLPAPIKDVTPQPSPVFKSDEFVTASYQPNVAINPGTPNSFSPGVEPPLILTLTPPPSLPGTLECLTIESQGVLSPSAATTLLIPSDFVPALLWGSLSDLLNMTLEKQDLPRAEYAKTRFEEYIALMAAYPFVLSARVNGLPVYVDAVEVLDLYASNWRAVTSNPSIVAISGQNLIAFPTSTAMSIILMVCANANIPVNDDDYVQLGDEVLDVILDEAQSVASFKMGGGEAAAAWPLHQNIVKLAAKRNDKIRSMAIFRDALFDRTKRERMITPVEVIRDV